MLALVGVIYVLVVLIMCMVIAMDLTAKGRKRQQDIEATIERHPAGHDDEQQWWESMDAITRKGPRAPRGLR